MFCGKCGNQIADGAAFCPHCGASTGASGNQQSSNDYGTGYSNTGYDNTSYGSEFGAGFASSSSNPNCTNGFKGCFGFWVEMWTKNYANAKTRATRKEYWSIIIINAIIGSILSSIWEPLGIVYSLAILVPQICVLIRRCHDIGKKGTLIIGVYITEIVGAILLSIGLYLCTVYYYYAVWYGYYRGYYNGGLALIIIGSIICVLAAVIMLIIGLKGSVREDNQWGPYPFK